MKTPFTVVALLSALLAPAVQAQLSPAAGTYLVDFDAQFQVGPDGTPQVSGHSKARMILEVRGDSVFGTWQTIDAANPRPARKLHGTLENGKLKLTSEPVESVINMNGQETRRSTIPVYTATVTGDAISGTIESPAPAPGLMNIARKFEGKREAAKQG